MERKPGRGSARITLAIAAVVLLIGVLVYQNTDIRKQLWFYEEPLCTRVVNWSRDSAVYRRGYLERTANFPEWSEWTTETYDELIQQLDDDIAWLEDNPPPPAAESARETYIENIRGIQSVLADARDGAFTSEDEFRAAMDPHYDPLISPATMYVDECDSE